MQTETKSQRVERIKQAKDGLEVINDIYVYAVMGLEVDPDDIDRFKWYGLSPQNKDLQDKDEQILYFTLCVKVPLGQLNLEQLEILESISSEFSRGTALLTPRQNIQFSFIQVRNLPEIFRRLDSVGLSTKFAAGDVPRNIVSCPVNGIDYDQTFDAQSIVEKVNNYLDGNKKLSNLPNKFKVSINACHTNCLNHNEQDIHFAAVKLSSTKILFDVYVMAENSAKEKTRTNIGQVTPSQVLNVVKALCILFRDHGDRTNRSNANLGNLLQSWGKIHFLEVLHKEINFKLKASNSSEEISFSHNEHLGIHESTVRAKSYIGCNINEGKLNLIGLKNLLLVLKQYEASAVKITSNQNIVIVDAPSSKAQEMYTKLIELKLDSHPVSLKDKTSSCTA